MPIVGWDCPSCGRASVALDHYETTECGEKIPSDYAAAVLASRNGHQSGVVEVSHGLGCPRSYMIQQYENYSVDPLSQNAPESGTAWHGHMEKHSTDKKNTEIALKGTIAGIEVHGKPDRIHPDKRRVDDHKNIGDFQVKYIKEEGAKQTHRMQLSLYAELIDQQLGWRPRTAVIFYHSAGSGFFPKKIGLSELGDVLTEHPLNGEYSVQQLLEQTDSVIKREKTWRDLPLAGQTQTFGSKTMCDYCAVRSVCTVAAFGAPF